MPLSEEQRQRLLDAMSEGRLPLDAPKQMYAGYGTGRACMGCNETIHRTQIEYEAEYADGRSYVLHLGCAGVWDAERRRRSATADAKQIQDKSEEARAKAQMTAKESAQLRDQANVLKVEAETIREKSKQVKRGQQIGLENSLVPDPIVRRLRNDCDANDTIICPDCRKPIALNVGVMFRDGFAFHVACMPSPHDTLESG